MFAKQSRSVAMFLIANRTMMGSRMAQYHRLIPVVQQQLFVQQQKFQLINLNNRQLCAKASSEASKIFEKAKTLVDDKLKDQINAKMVFCISGQNFVLDAVKDKPLVIEQVAEAPKDCDVTMIADEKTFMKLVKGETKPTMAFMTGKLKIKGDVKKAQKAEKMFTALQKDLK